MIRDPDEEMAERGRELAERLGLPIVVNSRLPPKTIIISTPSGGQKLFERMMAASIGETPESDHRRR